MKTTHGPTICEQCAVIENRLDQLFLCLAERIDQHDQGSEQDSTPMLNTPVRAHADVEHADVEHARVEHADVEHTRSAQNRPLSVRQAQAYL